MDFKAQVEKDIAGVFINPGEFAEPHSVDGVVVECVLDDDIAKEQTGLDQSVDYDGVFFVEKTLFIKESFFDKRPIEGQHMDVDGDYFTVRKVSANMGMLEILLRQDAT